MEASGMVGFGVVVVAGKGVLEVRVVGEVKAEVVEDW
jgi:hypothetical protein